jgi:protoporphyrin/coproporphyrin ferrochelatase
MAGVTQGSTSRDGLLVVAHGTVENLDDLPAFLARIRHGRPASPELLAEVRRRYELIGRSPLLDVTREQARLLGERLGVPAFVAMRLWDPSIESALVEAASHRLERLCVVPLAPFSVHVYVEAARAAAQKLLTSGERVPELVTVEAWGEHPAFVSAQAEIVARRASTRDSIVLTAHSLPLRVIDAGDPYAALAERTATAIGKRLNRDCVLSYQSQGADGGQWLGPDLRATLEALAAAGVGEVALSPFGFLSEHVETLYDLDVEAQAWARELGLKLLRVPAIGTHPGLIAALAETAKRALQH